MTNYNVTKDFKTFVDSISPDNYNEVYELYHVARNQTNDQFAYKIGPCPGSGQDILIIHEPSNNALRLSPKALAYLPEWIEQNLMNGLDAETFWGMEHAKEKDELEENTRKD